MRRTLFAILWGTAILLAFSVACRAQKVGPGKWIHRTLATAAANEAAQRAREIPPGRWWHLPYFATPLSITNPQKAQLDRLFDYNRNRLVQLKFQIERERIELVESMDREHLDERAATSRMKKLEDSRTLLASTRFTYSLEVRKLLGYQRFAQLKTLFRNWNGLQEYTTTEAAKRSEVKPLSAPQLPTAQQPGN